MNLDEMKSEWQNAAAAQSFQQEELKGMTSIKRHPVLNRIRKKLLVEAFAMLALLVLFNDAFDGASKPAYATMALVVGALLYLGSNLYSFFVLQHPISQANIYGSLQHFLSRLYYVRSFSLVASIVYAASLLLFFTSTIVFDAKKLLLLGGALIAFVVLLYFSFALWTKWISRIRQSISELQGEA